MNGNSFFKKKGTVGCLLIHGLTASTQEMEELSLFLYKRGYTILVPLLDGHNTSIRNLDQTSWMDWYRSLEDAHNFLTRNCSKIHLIGQSIGATLSLYYIANKRPLITSLVLLAPAIFYTNSLLPLAPALKYFKKYKQKDYSKHYPNRKDAFFDILDEEASKNRIAYKKVPLSSLSSALDLIKKVKPELKRITLPTLLIHSNQDHTIKPKSSKYIYDNIKTQNKKLIYLKESGHVVSVDVEKDIVFKGIFQFLQLVERQIIPP